MLRMEHNFSMKQKKSEPVPQMTHFQKLLFCSRGNLQHTVKQNKSTVAPYNQVARLQFQIYFHKSGFQNIKLNVRYVEDLQRKTALHMLAFIFKSNYVLTCFLIKYRKINHKKRNCHTFKVQFDLMEWC